MLYGSRLGEGRAAAGWARSADHAIQTGAGGREGEGEGGEGRE